MSWQRGRGSFQRGGGGYNRGSNYGGDEDPRNPAQLSEIGYFSHQSEGDLVCMCTTEFVPYFNAFVFLENKALIGKVDDVFGRVSEFYCSIKADVGVAGARTAPKTKLFVSSTKRLPVSRFTNPKESAPRGGGRGARGGRGGRGGGFGGFRGRGAGNNSFRGRGGGGYQSGGRGQGYGGGGRGFGQRGGR